jgi:iron complex outermembrane recepter protein
MVGNHRYLPRYVTFGILWSALLLSVRSAAAQTASDVGSPNVAGQSAADTQAGGNSKAASDILNLDIEQLTKTPVVVPSMDIPVSSVTKELSTVGHSAAAIFVITPEMIRRSGATTIPDALRMVPGMDVAQVNSDRWAISCRGFTSPFANKLLVLIDGRTVYNPDFSGVFWNVEDVLLEDVERIEVIRGPGGTLWGANAVNGVINIITKKAKDTQGVYAMAGGGTHERDMEAFRYGGQISEDLQYRVYGKYNDRGPNYDPTGQLDDAWQQSRVGFRADWSPDHDNTNTMTVQGDHFVCNTANSAVLADPTIPERLNGEDLLMRWRHVYDADSDWSLQAYYDNFTRIDSLQRQVDKTLDVEFQYRFPMGDRHSITCGAGFRNVDSYMPGGDSFTPLFPTSYFTTNYTNEFVQDEMAIVEDKLAFTLGCKLEQNPYTGLEYEPTARLLWTPDKKHSAWGAVSRAVRTPSRAEEQATQTIPIVPPVAYYRILPTGGLVSENVLAYELGYREQTTDSFSWDLATFYNVYDHVQGANIVGMIPPPPYLVMLASFNNAVSADSYGIELSGNYAVSKRWRLYTQYTLFEMKMYNNPLAINEGHDPHNQVYLRSSWDLREDMDFDLMARYIDSLPELHVPSYISMDLRLAWRPRKHLELAAVGQNLLQTHHLEYTDSATAGATEVVRGVYGTLTWRR